jgi:hypothetical protein
VAELVRIVHQSPVDEASALVDTLVEREVPLVWKVGAKRRVLVPEMKTMDKTLLLLHGCTAPVGEEELRHWVEHKDASVYRRDILRKAHTRKLIEYDPAAKTAVLSPKGVDYVEKTLIAPAN